MISMSIEHDFETGGMVVSLAGRFCRENALAVMEIVTRQQYDDRGRELAAAKAAPVIDLAPYLRR